MAGTAARGPSSSRRLADGLPPSRLSPRRGGQKTALEPRHFRAVLRNLGTTEEKPRLGLVVGEGEAGRGASGRS